VAIKVLLPGRSTRRFLKEAKLLATISSNNVVRVYDYDVLPDRRPVLSMEWFEDRDLRNVMQQGRVSEDAALPWMRQVAEGMLAASDQGVIHRDLKPSNILIDTKGRAER
jgi:serine/threonine protein kinase